MKIAGMQKLSLVDYPEKICCTVFTAGCNFRCPFCHNASLVTHIDGSDVPLSEVVKRTAKVAAGRKDGAADFFGIVNKRQ